MTTKTCNGCGHRYGARATNCPRCRTRKICKQCQRGLPLEAFNLNRLSADGRQWTCKECKSEIERERIYGLTGDQFDALLMSQGARCALCESPSPGGRSQKWHVDHDHETGRVRGLLCFACNIQLGLYEKFVANPRVQEYLR
jgi:hypothetical protein